MAFWETMTIRQTADMLKNRERPWLAEGWRELTDPICGDPNNLGGTFDNAARRLSNCSRVPAVHFFILIALIHSRPDAPPDFHRLAQEYLPNIRDVRMDAQGLFNRLYGNTFTDTARALSWLAEESADLDGDTKLSSLLSMLDAHNGTAYSLGEHAERAEWNFHGGLGTLREHLNAWDGTCREMWEAAQNQTVQEVCTLIEGGVRQIILTGAPGTGKTYTAGLAAKCMGAPLERYKNEDRPYPLVQFHPSYDYTDFVEGLRPVQTEGVQDNSFVRLDGSFKDFCRQVVAEENPDQLYFFLIDEINRADLSKVFGELMFCLESDKRGAGHKVQTQYRNLPAYQIDEETGYARLCGEDCFDKGFFIPENVVILGTMNDIDRSVESMDFALRRRFTWREVPVTEPLLTQAFSSGNFLPVLKDHAAGAARQVMALNRVIAPDKAGAAGEYAARFGLNRQYYIAQGQFTGLPERLQELDELLRFVWDCRLESLLREYVRGENEQEVELFLRDCRSAFLPERNGA